VDGDAHEILGVAFDADPGEVKDAYREMVKEHHPDVSDAPNAEEKFLNIRRAYEEMAERAEKREDGENGTGNNARKGGVTDTEEDVSSSRDVPPSGKAPESGSDSDSGSDSGFSFSTTSSSGSTQKNRRYARKNGSPETENRGNGHHKDEGERVEGLRGGWEILRGFLEDEQEKSWFVHRPRGGYYLNSEAGRTKKRHGFSSRSEAKKAYKGYMNSGSKNSAPNRNRKSGRGYHVTDKIDSRWRIIHSPHGFAVMSYGRPPTFLDDSGEEVINAHWFDSADGAKDAHSRRTQRAKPGMSSKTRLLLAPFLFPFLAVLKILRVLGGSDPDEKYKPYISGAVSTVLLFTLASIVESFILAGFAVVSLTLLSVRLLSPYEPRQE